MITQIWLIVPNLVLIGQTVVKIWPFFNFSPLIFKSSKFYLPVRSEWQYASLFQIWCRSVKLLQRYGCFLICQRWRPSAMLDVLRVFGPPTKKVWWSVTLQNLFGVGALVSIICNFQILKIFCLWLENAYSRPKNSVFFGGGIWPQKWGAVWQWPQTAHPCAYIQRIDRQNRSTRAGSREPRNKG